MGHCFAHKALDHQTVLEFAARALFAAIFAAQHLQAVPLKMSGPILVASSGHAQVAIVLGEHPQESYQYAAAELARCRRPPQIVIETSTLPIATKQTARRSLAARGTTLLSPFDSFLWHRERTQRLFGYDYRIEVYTPGHQRVHGYYTLPILHDGHLIGRLDAKAHRAERRLEARSVHLERWFATGLPAPGSARERVDRDRALAGVAEALHSLARFVGADRVDLRRVAPGRLRQPLARALRQAGGVVTPK